MCEGCAISQYNKKYYVRCKLNPRHKQRQKFSTVKYFEATSLLNNPELNLNRITAHEELRISRNLHELLV